MDENVCVDCKYSYLIKVFIENGEHYLSLPSNIGGDILYWCTKHNKVVRSTQKACELYEES